jgi:hypothetical protein
MMVLSVAAVEIGVRLIWWSPSRRCEAHVFGPRKIPYDKIRAMRTGLLLALLAIGLAGCGAATSGARSSNTPSGVVLFEDDFSSPASGWARVKYAEGIMDYDGGSYHMQVNVPQANFWSTPHKDFSDVRLEVDAGKLGGPDENRIGLICRSDGQRYYFFIISSDGYYGVGLFENRRATLLGQGAMQFSTQIKTGAAINHLRADCTGDDLSAYVNGVRLASVKDPTLSHGDVGILAGAFGQPGVDIVFDNFAVLEP